MDKSEARKKWKAKWKLEARLKNKTPETRAKIENKVRAELGLPSYSQEILDSILNNTSFFNAEVHKNLNIRDKNLTTNNYKIPYWQTVKIRKIFQQIDGALGYKSKFAHSMDNFSLFMIQIPQEYRIETTLTQAMWEMDMTEENGLEMHMLDGRTIETEAFNERWRNVYIYFDNNFYADIIESIIPLSIDSALKKLCMAGLGYLYPIYENLAFRNTMSKELIYSNFDKIREELNKWGY